VAHASATAERTQTELLESAQPGNHRPTVQFSWDLEFVDVDNDFDLDLAVSCKKCSGSFLFVNETAPASFLMRRTGCNETCSNTVTINP
jgi:hypothetical protein